MFCPNCGSEIKDTDYYCPNCGTRLYSSANGTVDDTTRTVRIPDVSSSRSRLVALLFVLFLGSWGIHRFYVGKTGTGILWLLTFGVFGIGTLVDLITICMGTFTDKEGKKLTEWN